MATKFEEREFEALSRVRFGQSNPEHMTNPLWLAAHARYITPDRLIEEFAIQPAPRVPISDDEIARRYKQPHSSDREGVIAPFWCFYGHRSAGTRTHLADGRLVHIGGSYDDRFKDRNNFCIYNEVTVEYDRRSIDIFSYPKTVFPPVHHHSATEVGSDIVLIGGTGYIDLSDPSACPVFKLNTASFRIEPLQTHGVIPAGLHRHGAIRIDDRRIQISGGCVSATEGADAAGNFVLNRKFFELDLATLEWRALASDEPCWLGITAEDFWAQTRPRYGAANPEPMNVPLWNYLAREKLGGYSARARLGVHDYPVERLYPGHAFYREHPAGPVWAAAGNRFGSCSIECPDGRLIHIAGEHEDAYDADFCIYNDVIDEHPDGQIEIYGYPKDVFPPTDFHTATAIGDNIILIGSVGYQDMRKAGKVQVFKLDTKTYRIEAVATTGNQPGWIGSHSAEYLAPNTIIIRGGSIMQADGSFTTNTKMFELGVENWTWRMLRSGDTRFFAVTIDEYTRSKYARYGTANPEHIDNAFWIEMSKKQWPPSRARQHFDDLALHTNQEDNNQIGERKAVWTSMREHALAFDLRDGRRLAIGGEVMTYSDERSDAWFYNDIIVHLTDGNMAIYGYPLEVFPFLVGLSALERDGELIIFGRGHYNGTFAHMPMAFVLDLTSFTIRLLDRTSSRKPAVLTQEPTLEGDKAVFPIQKQTADDPDRTVTFSLKTLRWQI